jgi:hypothetical protein
MCVCVCVCVCVYRLVRTLGFTKMWTSRPPPDYCLWDVIMVLCPCILLFLQAADVIAVGCVSVGGAYCVHSCR